MSKDRELMQQALEALNHVNVQDRVQIIAALRERLAQPQQEPVAYRSRLASGDYTYCKTAQFFDNAEPLYTSPPQRKPLTDEQKAVLKECRNEAMKWTSQARIPECGAFGGIAQDLDWLCGQLAIDAAHGIKEQDND